MKFHKSGFILSVCTAVTVLAIDPFEHQRNHIHHDHHHNRELYAERKCNYQAPTEEQRVKIEADLTTYKANSKTFSKNEIITINVHWHVISGSNQEGNIADALIQKSIAVLNDAFGGVSSQYPACSGGGVSFSYENNVPTTPFRFNLVETTRTRSDAAFDLDSGASESFREGMRRGTCADLNIFTGDTQYLGFAFLAASCPNGGSTSRPSAFDAVMLLHTSVADGGLSGYDEGDTLVHEVGHWLGLDHTFDGGCNGNGDSVSDTAAEGSPATGCPIGRDTCQAGAEDPIHNYMDYSDDCCMYRFTPGQIERMVTHAGAYRGLGSGVLNDDDGNGGNTGDDDDDDNNKDDDDKDDDDKKDDDEDDDDKNKDDDRGRDDDDRGRDDDDRGRDDDDRGRDDDPFSFCKGKSKSMSSWLSLLMRWDITQVVKNAT